MKVKVGNKIYDSEKEPVMVILNERDKEHISNLGNNTKYCNYPDLECWVGNNHKGIIEWMET